MGSTLARLSVTFALATAVLSAPFYACAEARPVAFEMNRGQADGSAQFVVRGPGGVTLLKPSEAVIAVTGPAKAEAVRMTIIGANPRARVHATDPLSARTNYVTGTDASRWLPDVPSFARVTYEGIYPAIDLVYHARNGQLEYDFVVAPGADPHAIQLGFDGATGVEIDERGDLVLRTAAGDIRKPRPLIYQDQGDDRRMIDGRYVMSADGTVAFDVGPYDATLPLVIDPVIAYSTFWGGAGDDGGRRIAVDTQGNVYVVGTTDSANFPVTAGAWQRTFGGAGDVFVTKFSPTGAVIYSTYIGGDCDDYAGGIAVDTAGNAYVTGRHDSCIGGQHPLGTFVVKLGPTGAGVYYQLLAASYMDDSWGQAVAVDGAGNAYVTGVTSSASHDFPTTPGAFRTTPCLGDFFPGYDGWVAKLNASGTLVYSTYLCGTMNDSPNAIKVDAAGNAYVVGSTESHDFSTLNPIQAENKAGLLYSTGFVAKLKPDGSGLVYSTYLGGSDGDTINDVALDGARNVYVTGNTTSGDFPVTAGVVQPAAGFPICSGGPCANAFGTKINATGTGLVYSTYITGSGDDVGTSIAVDGAGNAYIAGATWSSYLPVVDAFRSMRAGSQDGFVVKLNATGTRFLYGSYLGGSRGTTNSQEGIDQIIGIALDGNGNAWVTGATRSRDFPVTGNAVQRTLAGGACDQWGSPCADAFVTKITAGGPGVVPAISLSVTPTDVATGGTITASWNGIPIPTADDYLTLYELGGLSDSTYRVAYWPTTGAASGTLQLAIPATVPPGWYELRLLSGTAAQVLAPGVVARSAPINIGPHADVVVTAVTNPPAIAVVGSSFTVTETTANRGNLASKGSVTRFYLSADRARNTGDRVLTGSRSIGVLAPNATSTGTTNVTIPAATPVGTYVLLACADDTSTNIESNEGNNCIASAGSVSIRAPDLAATAVGNPPATARVGTSFNVSDSTTNRGSAASTPSVTRYYLSLDRVKTSGDRLLTGVRNVPLLVPGAVSSGAATVTVPATTPVGTYFLIACGDDTKVTAESSETNNCIASATAVSVTP